MTDYPDYCWGVTTEWEGSIHFFFHVGAEVCIQSTVSFGQLSNLSTKYYDLFGSYTTVVLHQKSVPTFFIDYEHSLQMEAVSYSLWLHTQILSQDPFQFFIVQTICPSIIWIGVVHHSKFYSKFRPLVFVQHSIAIHLCPRIVLQILRKTLYFCGTTWVHSAPFSSPQSQ